MAVPALRAPLPPGSVVVDAASQGPGPATPLIAQRRLQARKAEGEAR